MAAPVAPHTRPPLLPRLWPWLPPVAWMALVLGLSTDAGSAQHTSRILEPLLRWLLPQAPPAQIAALHGLARKVAHVVEYAVLAALWFRAFGRGARWRPAAAAGAALALAAALAAVDEASQARLATRTGRAGDVLYDLAGAATTLALLGAGWHATLRATTTGLLWAAAAGGTALLLVDLATGVPAGVLWVTAPAAVALLVLRRRRLRA